MERKLEKVNKNKMNEMNNRAQHCGLFFHYGDVRCNVRKRRWGVSLFMKTVGEAEV